MTHNICMLFLSIGGMILSIGNAIDDHKEYKENKESYLKLIKYGSDYITDIYNNSAKTYKKSYKTWLAASICWFICFLINLFFIFLY